MPSPYRPHRASAGSAAVAVLLVVLGCSTDSDARSDAVRSTTSTTEPSTPGLVYEADDGPGEIGGDVDPAELGISGVTEPAVKLDRRTYRIPEPGGSTTVVIAPTRWTAADAAAARAAAPPPVADCAALATADAAAADTALAGVTPDDVARLPLVDRQYAISERLLPMFADSRASVAAAPCDLDALATAVLAQVQPSTLAVMNAALPQLDLTGSTPAEPTTPFGVEQLAGLLQPVTR